jgi:hypothetical protein
MSSTEIGVANAMDILPQGKSPFDWPYVRWREGFDMLMLEHGHRETKELIVIVRYQHVYPLMALI